MRFMSANTHTNTKHPQRRLFTMLLSFLISFVCLGSSTAVYSAKAVPLDYAVSLKGEEISNVTDHYKGAVNIVFQLQDTTNTATFWIKQGNVWMLVNHKNGDPPGQYRVSFTKNGDYDLSFKTENPETLEKIVKVVTFTISSQMSAAEQAINALPDPETSSNDTVLAAKDQVRIAMNLVNGLPSKQRRLMPGAMTEKLSWLCSILEGDKNGLDYTPPKEPSIEMVSSDISTQNCYSSAVTAMIFPENEEDAQKVLIDDGEGWKQLEKNAEGKYAVTFSEEKQYEISFCTSDSNDNRSTASVHKFSIDKDVPLILSEIQRIRTNASELPLDDYITGLEKIYMQFLNLPPRRQALVPDTTQEQLITMYDDIMEHIDFTYKDYDEDNRYIEAIGLYQSLDVSMKWLQREPISIHAERVKPPTTVAGVNGTALATYKISVTPEELGGEKIAMNSTIPVKICIQLPEDLKGKKNVDMFLVEGKNAKPMGAKVRSTKDNLVLYFDITGPGDYVLVSKAA